MVGGAATVALVALAAPSLAPAQPIPLEAPTVTTTVQDTALSVTVANPNTDPTATCGAIVFESAKLPDFQADPTKIDEAGFLTWRTDD
ncbi:hypothetical protein EGT50_16655, partial [Rhodococcus xishaensis]